MRKYSSLVVNVAYFSITIVEQTAPQPSFFVRALLPYISSQYMQTFISLEFFLMLAFAVCAILGSLSYALSISTSQDTEKRSEYECGFAPFDSATRLPFDVSFYLVGILFLIFDVEVALVFPWTLDIHKSMWGEYWVMAHFITILSVGFLYEWRRGALKWSTKEDELVPEAKSLASKSLALPAILPEEWSEEIATDFAGLSISPFLILFAIFLQISMSRAFEARRNIPTTPWVRVSYFIFAMFSVLQFVVLLEYSYLATTAQVFTYFMSVKFEGNPFFPYLTHYALWAYEHYSPKQQKIIRAVLGYSLALLFFYLAFGVWSLFIKIAKKNLRGQGDFWPDTLYSCATTGHHELTSSYNALWEDIYYGFMLVYNFLAPFATLLAAPFTWYSLILVFYTLFLGYRCNWGKSVPHPLSIREQYRLVVRSRRTKAKADYARMERSKAASAQELQKYADVLAKLDKGLPFDEEEEEKKEAGKEEKTANKKNLFYPAFFALQSCDSSIFSTTLFLVIFMGIATIFLQNHVRTGGRALVLPFLVLSSEWAEKTFSSPHDMRPPMRELDNKLVEISSELSLVELLLDKAIYLLVGIVTMLMLAALHPWPERRVFKAQWEQEKARYAKEQSDARAEEAAKNPQSVEMHPTIADALRRPIDYEDEMQAPLPQTPTPSYKEVSPKYDFAPYTAVSSSEETPSEKTEPSKQLSIGALLSPLTEFFTGIRDSFIENLRPRYSFLNGRKRQELEAIKGACEQLQADIQARLEYLDWLRSCEVLVFTVLLVLTLLTWNHLRVRKVLTAIYTAGIERARGAKRSWIWIFLLKKIPATVVVATPIPYVGVLTFCSKVDFTAAAFMFWIFSLRVYRRLEELSQGKPSGLSPSQSVEFFEQNYAVLAARLSEIDTRLLLEMKVMLVLLIFFLALALYPLISPAVSSAESAALTGTGTDNSPQQDPMTTTAPLTESNEKTTKISVQLLPWWLTSLTEPVAEHPLAATSLFICLAFWSGITWEHYRSYSFFKRNLLLTLLVFLPIWLLPDCAPELILLFAYPYFCFKVDGNPFAPLWIVKDLFLRRLYAWTPRNNWAYTLGLFLLPIICSLFLQGLTALGLESFLFLQAILTSYLLLFYVWLWSRGSFWGDRYARHFQRNSLALLLVPATLDLSSLLAPISNLMTCVQRPTLALVAELSIFALVSYLLVVLASDLGNKHVKHTLAMNSWRALVTSLIFAVLIYFYQFAFGGVVATAMHDYFYVGGTSAILQMLTLASALFVLDASETFMRSSNRHLLEYPIMLVFTAFFMVLLVGANHIMTSFLSLVGFSLGLYVLILYEANKHSSREAGLKYYYLSTLSSGLILYGILLLYVLTGTGNFDELFFSLNSKFQFQAGSLLQTAVLMLLAGFFFKLSAFPGHLWAADVYEGSPAPVTAFFMLPVKIVVLGAFIRLFTVALSSLAAYWLPFLTLTVMISILWGAFASVQEKKFRRFLAYASINQMGFLLLGFTTDTDEGYQAALVYIILYAIMTCALLTIFLSARRADSREITYLSDFRMLARKYWFVGWSFAIVLFSMAGIPPLGGFFAKYLVLIHSFESGLMVPVVVGLATSLLSSYYYLRVIKTFMFEQAEGAMPVSPGLIPRRQVQLFTFEALLWAFIVFAPVILSFSYSLAYSQGVMFQIFLQCLFPSSAFALMFDKISISLLSLQCSVSLSP